MKKSTLGPVKCRGSVCNICQKGWQLKTMHDVNQYYISNPNVLACLLRNRLVEPLLAAGLSSSEIKQPYTRRKYVTVCDEKHELNCVAPIILNGISLQIALDCQLLRPVESDPTQLEIGRESPIFTATEPSLTRTSTYWVYRDLWSKGWCLTSGAKFGVDFLAYSAFPTKVHATFMVHVVSESQTDLPLQEYCKIASIAMSASKTVLKATVSQDGERISYLTLDTRSTVAEVD